MSVRMPSAGSGKMEIDKMKKKKRMNRYVILVILFVNMISIGGSYAWSVFSMPLSETQGWDFSKVTVAYSMLLFFLAFTGIIGGKVLDRFGPKIVMTIAGLVWGLGWFLTGFAGNVAILYVTFGAMCGISGGFFYNPAVTTAVRWFPDKRGFASGLIVGAAGLSPLILAPIANALLTSFGVMNAFRYLGLAFFILALITTWMLQNPDPEFAAEMAAKSKETDKKPAAQTLTLTETDWRGMFKDKLFYLMWLAFFCGSFSGIMIIGHVSGIGQDLAHITPTQAAMMVGVMALANFFGRLIMGSISDKIGRYPTLILAVGVNILDMILLSRVNSFPTFVVAVVIAGVCFGGVLAVFPTITSEAFGLKNMGVNYGIMFTAYGISALFGPSIAANFRESAGTYTPAFIISAIISAAALALIVITMVIVKNRKNKLIQRGVQDDKRYFEGKKSAAAEGIQYMGREDSPRTIS